MLSDNIINNCVIIKNKAAEAQAEKNEFQLIYSADIDVGLLLNFGKTPEYKLKIFTNNRKGNVHNLGPIDGHR